LTRAVSALLFAASLAVGCASDPQTTVVGVRATGCRPFPERGSGALVQVDGHDRPLVLTAAHVVAGANEITVAHEQTQATARVVAFDPDMDLAYLAVDRLHVDTVATVDRAGVEPGTSAVARVVRDGDPVEVPVTIVRRIDIRTEDVYVEGATRRPGYELAAEIEEGDSGGPIVVDGTVVGVVWARSRSTDTRAYAIDPVRAGERLRRQLDTGDLGDVDLTRCP
jgi:S1-C subfamily serine protease